MNINGLNRLPIKPVVGLSWANRDTRDHGMGTWGALGPPGTMGPPGPPRGTVWQTDHRDQTP